MLGVCTEWATDDDHGMYSDEVVLPRYTEWATDDDHGMYTCVPVVWRVGESCCT